MLNLTKCAVLGFFIEKSGNHSRRLTCLYHIKKKKKKLEVNIQYKKKQTLTTRTQRGSEKCSISVCAAW